MTWQKLRRLEQHEHPLLSGDPIIFRGHVVTPPHSIWINDRYEVQVIEGHRSLPIEDLPRVTYLSIKRLEKDAIHDWRHLQTIKNELCGFEREGIEIYPAESRLQDEANQYHMFVFPEGFVFPYGDFSGRHVDDSAPDEYRHDRARQRPFEEGTRVPKSTRRKARKKGSPNG